MKRFDYVDHHIPNADAHPLTRYSGFNRYTVRAIEDKACDAWRASPRFQNSGGRYGLADDECIAVTLIETLSMYGITRRLDQIRGSFPTWLSKFKNEIWNVDTNETMPIYRRYGHTPFIYALWPEHSGSFLEFDSDFGVYSTSKFRSKVLSNRETSQ